MRARVKEEKAAAKEAAGKEKERVKAEKAAAKEVAKAEKRLRRSAVRRGSGWPRRQS